MRSTVLAVAFSTMSVLACGSDTPTGNGTPTVASVVVTPSTATLESLGETVQLTASAQNASGSTIAGKTFTWSSSNESAATVSSSGLVTAQSNGSASIRATTEGVNGTSAIGVDLRCGPSGMVSWWPGNGNPFDVIGPNEGTLVAGVTFASGKVGQAFSFDGVNAYVGLDGAGINDLQQFTLEAWVQLKTMPPRYEYLVMLDGNEKAVLRYDGVNGPGQLHFFIKVDGVLRHVRANNVLQVGVFHHIAGTYDGSVMRLFLDGAEVGSFSVSGTVGPATGVVFSSSNNADTLDGVVDEVSIYDHALTVAEIQGIFDAGSAGKCGG